MQSYALIFCLIWNETYCSERKHAGFFHYSREGEEKALMVEQEVEEEEEGEELAEEER